MAAAKCKHIIFPFTVVSVSFILLITNYLFFTINYSRHISEFRNVSSYIRSLSHREWFEVISTEIKYESMSDDVHLKSISSPKWLKIVVHELGGDRINIGVVNGKWIEDYDVNSKIVKIEFDPVGEDVKWSHLAPERMDESSKCPNIPMPKFENYQSLDVVVAEISNEGLRDVNRLQVNLVVLNLLARSGRRGHIPVLAVFMGSGDPMWEIFKCDDLLWKEGNARIYRPDMDIIKQMIQLPVGACEFVPPFSHHRKFESLQMYPGNQESWIRKSESREAYVTVLHTSEEYVCGAIALAQSIIQSNSTKELVLLADENISKDSIRALEYAGWQALRITRIRSPFSRRNTYNEWNYSKLRIWQLTQYKKLIFVDADLIVNKNADRFFAYPQLTAAGNYQNHLFNSGLMVVEPSECTFRTLMKKMMVVESYNGGDQGFLNEMFPWWHRLPAQANYLKVFVDPHDRVHWINNDVFVVHYTGMKPWKCFKDWDCNWDFPQFHRYASHSAQRLWRKVHRNMPKNLRHFCSAHGYQGNNITNLNHNVKPLMQIRGKHSKNN